MDECGYEKGSWNMDQPKNIEEKNLGRASFLTVSRILRFFITCRLYIRMKMKDTSVEEQVQWVLLYVQGKLVDIWKENIMENLENESLEFVTIEEYLMDLKKEFSEKDNEIIKVAELKKIE